MPLGRDLLIPLAFSIFITLNRINEILRMSDWSTCFPPLRIRFYFFFYSRKSQTT